MQVENTRHKNRAAVCAIRPVGADKLRIAFKHRLEGFRSAMLTRAFDQAFEISQRKAIAVHPPKLIAAALAEQPNPVLQNILSAKVALRTWRAAPGAG